MISGANYLATLDHFDDIQNNHSEIVANYLATAFRWYVGLLANYLADHNHHIFQGKTEHDFP